MTGADVATPWPVCWPWRWRAVAAGARSSTAIGEWAADVDHHVLAALGAARDPLTAALHLPCLVEAIHAVADTARLHLLVEHRATVLTADTTADWQALATT